MHNEWLRNDDYQSEHGIGKAFTSKNKSIRCDERSKSIEYNSKIGKLNIFPRYLFK